MPARSRFLGLVALLASSCTISSTTGDPCEGIELPACPPACAPAAFENCGQPCEVEDESCGNEIGDGMTCVGGAWQCVVHAPLGTGCNLVCRPGPR